MSNKYTGKNVYVDFNSKCNVLDLGNGEGIL